MQKAKIAFALNILLFVCCMFSVGWMMSGISSGALSSAGLGMLKYFTVDSNILMGVVALVVAIDQWGVVRGTKSDISILSYVLKLMGTASVTLTMLVTVFFLTPTMYSTYGLFGLFMNSNFFMHLLDPLLAVVVFARFEKTDRLTIKHAVAGIVPMAVYAVYYVAECVIHSQGGVIQKGYDWYGFFFAGLQSGFIVLPIIFLITFGISCALRKMNRVKSR